MRQTIEKSLQWVMRQWELLVAPDNRWMARPVAAAALLVLLVAIKSCQGIAFYHSAEGKLYRTGYPVQEARILASQLTAAQIDSLVARQCQDTVICRMVTDRYYIADYLERYLALHKSDTLRNASDIIAMVNVGADNKWQDPVACDTTKGYLMLTNRSHYLDSHYRCGNMVTFEKDYAFGDHPKADSLVVGAFYMMRQACQRQTAMHLMVNSAYRSYKEQQDTHKQNSKKLAAPAGHSEHQTGLSLDIVSQEHLLKWEFGKSLEGKWLRDHCHEFGFILRYPEGKGHITGYDYEPWHLRYVGKETAQRIHDEGITFDEYYAFYIERETR